MAMAERSEMAVPKWCYETICNIVIFMILVLATIVAILNLFFQVAIIASCIWLAIMAFGIWLNCKQDGGFRKVFISYVEIFARRQFVESIPQDSDSVEIRFGFRLFGYRLVRFGVPLNKIETVGWSPGQAPRFWNVFIWFDHDDPELSQKRQKQKWSYKPDQDIYCVGPSRLGKRTKVFGVAFVEFLRHAGATLVQGEDDHTFVRTTPATQTHEKPSAR